MAGHAMRPLRVPLDYCGDGNPVIAQEFRPGRGWRRAGWRKRASASWLAKLRREGITDVALDVGGRVADFTINELLRGGVA